jgi:hypothetical protein
MGEAGLPGPSSTQSRTYPTQESEPVAVAMSELAPSPTRDARVEEAEMQEEAEMERIKSINQITANARLATGQSDLSKAPLLLVVGHALDPLTPRPARREGTQHDPHAGRPALPQGSVLVHVHLDLYHHGGVPALTHQ